MPDKRGTDNRGSTVPAYDLSLTIGLPAEKLSF